MVSILKERPQGGFYCSECRMGTTDLVDTCPYCGSIISNYESILENDMAKTFISDITQNPPPSEIRGLRRYAGILEDAPMIDGNMYEAIVEGINNEELTEQQKNLLQQLKIATQELHDSLFEGEENESNIH